MLRQPRWASRPAAVNRVGRHPPTIRPIPSSISILFLPTNHTSIRTTSPFLRQALCIRLSCSWLVSISCQPPKIPHIFTRPDFYLRLLPSPSCHTPSFFFMCFFLPVMSFFLRSTSSIPFVYCLLSSIVSVARVVVFFLS